MGRQLSQCRKGRLGRELINRLRRSRAIISVPGPKAAFGRVPCQVAKVPRAEITEALDRLMMRGSSSKILEARGGRNSHSAALLLVNLTKRPSQRKGGAQE